MQQSKGYPEPPISFWRDPASYDNVLERDFLAPLRAAANSLGTVPLDLQQDVLRRLHWYFTVDARERAPTVRLGAAQAPAFHECVGEILKHVDAAVIERLSDPAIPLETLHVLYSWHGRHGCSPATVSAFDHAQGLVQLRYYVHGPAPREDWRIDGRAATPAYAKYRDCRYFHRNCLQERIVWLPASTGLALELRLGDAPHPILLEPSLAAGLVAEPTPRGLNLAEASAAFWRGRGGRKSDRCPLPARLKARLMGWLAGMPWVRAKYRRAWVFVDRNENADDNAEHLYRWVRAHHPEVNAWFLLNPDSPDWPRLAADGFRLVAPGLERKLLILNCEHLISSHAEYMDGGLDRRAYAPLLRWCATFIPHGISKDDVSTWLGPLRFDMFVTCSPGEHESIRGSGNNYPYTDREVRLNGLPRHDRLLERVRARKRETGNASSGDSIDRTILVFPTWRGGRFEEETRGLTTAECLKVFAETEYAHAWRSVLRNQELKRQLQRFGWRLKFMPHANIAPYLSALDIPDSVEVIAMQEQAVQPTLIGARALLTDYSSMAFEMALLRRPTFYYQFDRDRFYGGDHNWRPGYFDYGNDGFGPVLCTEAKLIEELSRYMAANGSIAEKYSLRMSNAMPLDDGRACERTFEALLTLQRGWPQSRNASRSSSTSGVPRVQALLHEARSPIATSKWDDRYAARESKSIS